MRAWPITARRQPGRDGGTVAHGTAEAIADITSTGETLRANHLKVLPDALILRSEATLWRSRRAEDGRGWDRGAVCLARNALGSD
jgi:ATP phosphoribosyltransferase